MSCAPCKTYFLESAAYFQAKLSSEDTPIKEKHTIRQLELLLEEVCFHVGTKDLRQLSSKTKYKEQEE